MTDPVIRLVDDDPDLLEALSYMLACEGFKTRTYPDAETFLSHDSPAEPGCVLLDFRMPGVSGIDLQATLVRTNYPHPVIFLTAHADVEMVIAAFRKGADDLLQKPADPAALLAAVQKAVAHDQQNSAAAQGTGVPPLTERESQINDLAKAGLSSAQIAERLSLSKRTVETHRANILRKQR